MAGMSVRLAAGAGVYPKVPKEYPKNIQRASRASRLQAKSLIYKVAHIAQSVEHILGKDEVTGSIPVVSSTRKSEGSSAQGAATLFRVQSAKEQVCDFGMPSVSGTSYLAIRTRLACYIPS